MNESDAAADWRRLHPLTPLFRSLQLFYVLVVAGFVASLGDRPVILLFLAAAVIGVSFNVLAYLRFRYLVTEDSLIIKHGVLFRQRRVIPRSRIQNVDLSAGVLQQIFAVVTARVETAGGGGTEATLHLVTQVEAARLRRTLVTHPADIPELAQRPPAELFARRVSLLDLAIAGATSNRAGVLVGVLLGGNYFFDFMPTDWLLRRFLPPELLAPEAAVESLVTLAQHDLQAAITGVAVLALLFAVAGWALSVLASVVRFFDFTLSGRGDELRVSYGLVTRREKGFRLQRVQNLQIEEPILRRWLKLASLRLQTAGYGPMVKEAGRIDTLAPIARLAQLPDYLSLVCPGLDWEAIEWRPSHPRARRRMFVRRAIVIILVSGALAVTVTRVSLFLLLALVPAWFLAAAHYRHLAHARQGNYVLMREGLWNRRSYVVPIQKIQALQLRQSPIQRWLGLGTLTLETAGDPMGLHLPRAIDLGTSYANELMEGLATEVTGTGLAF